MSTGSSILDILVILPVLSVNSWFRAETVVDNISVNMLYWSWWR